MSAETTGDQPLSQEVVVFSPPKDCKYWASLRKLQEIDKKYILWIIDVEFAVVSGHNAVPYQIVVRDGTTGAIVISTLVDYSISTRDLMKAIDTYNTKGSYMSEMRLRMEYQGTIPRD
jgi:hypothetical protein